MKVEVLSMTKTSMGKKDLPAQFAELIRPDLIKRAVESLQANRRVPYGAKDHAGMRASAELSRRRRKYRGSYGKGISRVQRKIMTRRGTQMYMVGAFSPGTVGGRRAHPPKSEKVLSKKINRKENRKAIRSAMAATTFRNLVEQRGHAVPKEYPFIVESKIESITSTKTIKQALEKLELKQELERTSERKIRAGRGKLRGRKYKSKKGPLIVVSKECPLINTATNIPGIDVITVDSLNTEALAPGASIGRFTIFTDAAIERLSKEGLFMNEYKGPKPDKSKETEKDSRDNKESKKEKKPKKKGDSKSKASSNAGKKSVSADKEKNDGSASKSAEKNSKA
ncbi:50S ribosomal protein L4 [Candidatus Woesearchaeota archaeon]|nr:50S ribosomal protein L4 [Candidatus Woesearchaeota archaeon]